MKKPREKNTIPCILETRRKAILEEFNFWMHKSGHTLKFRQKITAKVITTYQSWVSAEKEGIRPLYRLKDDIIRNRKMTSEKHDWYK